MRYNERLLQFLSPTLEEMDLFCRTVVVQRTGALRPLQECNWSWSWSWSGLHIHTWDVAFNWEIRDRSDKHINTRDSGKPRA